MQGFDEEVAKVKSELAKALAVKSEHDAHLETSQKMYAEAQADLSHLNDKYKRAKHLLSQRHWRGLAMLSMPSFEITQEPKRLGASNLGRLSCSSEKLQHLRRGRGTMFGTWSMR